MKSLNKCTRLILSISTPISRYQDTARIRLKKGQYLQGNSIIVIKEARHIRFVKKKKNLSTYVQCRMELTCLR